MKNEERITNFAGWDECKVYEDSKDFIDSERGQCRFWQESGTRSYGDGYYEITLIRTK